MPFNQSIVILELPQICKSTTLPSIVILSRAVRDDDSTKLFDWVPKLTKINYMKWICTLQRDNFLLHISLDFPSKHHWSNNMLSFYLSPVVWSVIVESLLFILYIFLNNIESSKKLVVELKDIFQIWSHFKNSIWLNKLLLWRICKDKQFYIHTKFEMQWIASHFPTFLIHSIEIERLTTFLFVKYQPTNRWKIRSLWFLCITHSCTMFGSFLQEILGWYLVG